MIKKNDRLIDLIFEVFSQCFQAELRAQLDELTGKMDELQAVGWWIAVGFPLVKQSAWIALYTWIIHDSVVRPWFGNTKTDVDHVDVLGSKNSAKARKEDIEKAVGNKREEGREMRSQLNTMKRLGISWMTWVCQRPRKQPTELDDRPKK